MGLVVRRDLGLHSGWDGMQGCVVVVVPHTLAPCPQREDGDGTQRLGAGCTIVSLPAGRTLHPEGRLVAIGSGCGDWHPRLRAQHLALSAVLAL